MKSAEFRLIAIDESRYWDDLPEHITAYGVYLFRVGEATYCASTSPASWLFFLCNVLDGATEEQWERHYHEGTDQYVGYIDPDRMPALVSEPFTVEIEDDEAAELEGEEAIVDRLWELAIEEANANPPSVPGIT